MEWNSGMVYGVDSEQLNHVTDALLNTYYTAWVLTILQWLMSKSFYCLVWYVCLAVSDIVVGYI